MSPHMSSQYGELRPTSGWDLLVSLRHPCKCQRVSRLDSVTARHSSSGRQPNLAALNRGRHIYSAGRPSRWALAHISSSFVFTCHPPCVLFLETWQTSFLTAFIHVENRTMSDVMYCVIQTYCRCIVEFACCTAGFAHHWRCEWSQGQSEISHYSRQVFQPA